MRKHHPKNERVKHQYFTYLEDARRMSASTVDQVAAAIAQFETSTGHRDFAAFHYEQARKFKRQLDEGINPETGKPLAKATIYSRLMAVKAFFVWLAGQSGYRSKLTYSDMEYFNLSNNDGRIAKASVSRPAPTLEQVRQAVMSMPGGSDIERRNRALIAFAIVSGARDDAIASMLIRHVDLASRTVFHDAREVRSKNRKTFTSIFFPVGPDFEEIVFDWISFLTRDRLYSLDDPLFPATKVKVGESGLFESAGLDRLPWCNATAIRRIFRKAFETAGLPYYNPHSFRKTLGALGERICQTPEAMKAWSQNLAHDSVLTTFTSYGTVRQERQAEILNDLNLRIIAGTDADEPDPESVRKVVAWIQRKAS
jgi:integrase/recombinase XerC